MTVMASLTLVATFIADDPLKLIEQLYRDEALGERISSAVASGNSRSRAFNANTSRLATWLDMACKSYPPQEGRPRIVRRELGSISQHDAGSKPIATDESVFPTDHRKLKVRSVLDLPLWEKAGWMGVFLGVHEPGFPPIIGRSEEHTSALQSLMRISYA